MKKIIKRRIAADFVRRDEIKAKMIFAATHAEREALKFLNALPEGLTEDFVEESREKNGKNTVTHGKKESLFKRICGAFINPFTLFYLSLRWFQL